MSSGIDALALKEEDVTKFLAATSHIGSTNMDIHMATYVFKRRNDGVHLINLKRTWEKLLLAARAIAAIENPADVCAISARPYGQRAVLKFASYTGSTPIAGRFTPGTFTNQIQAAFREPRLLVVTDPRVDHQPVREASYVNIPVIAFCNTDSPLKFVDIAIPCNNKAPNSIGLMWWMLCREVLRLRGSIPGNHQPWEIMPDLFFYRDPEEIEKEEQAAQLAVEQQEEQPAQVAYDRGADDWGEGATEPKPEAPFAAVGTAAPGTDNWGTNPSTDDWGASAPAATAEDWGASATTGETWT